ncbi:MAG: hypothetical protein KKG78_03900, partial [Alphaproteobacteria bacterium]|nr:hypothetical protein [Alphaproteobacteria bacterium]
QPVVKSIAHLVVCQSTCLDNRSVYRCKSDRPCFLQFIGFVGLAKNSCAWCSSSFDGYRMDSHRVIEASLQKYRVKYLLDAEVVFVRGRWRSHIEQIFRASHSKRPPSQLQKTLKHYWYLSFL